MHFLLRLSDFLSPVRDNALRLNGLLTGKSSRLHDENCTMLLQQTVGGAFYIFAFFLLGIAPVKFDCRPRETRLRLNMNGTIVLIIPAVLVFIIHGS